MNEEPMSLTEIIKAREATIERLKVELTESEEQYVALQQTNAENWTKCQTLSSEKCQLQGRVQHLEKDLEAAREDEKYWRDNLIREQDKNSAQEAAYLKVIKTLGGRD